MFTCACIAALALFSTTALAANRLALSLSSGPTETQQFQDGSVEAAARRFRVQIYNTYRLDRDEFNRRRAAWEQVQARSRQAGNRPQDQQALLLWLEEATYQSRPDVRGLLPAVPAFGTFSVPPHRRAAAPTIREVSPAHAPAEITLPRAIAAPRSQATNPAPQTVEAVAPPHRIALARPIVNPRAIAVGVPLPSLPGGVAAGSSIASTLNVGELLARASGYSDALRTLDSVLHESAELSAAELAGLLAELETLLGQRRDLLLYEQLVSAPQRDRLVRLLAFPKTTVAELGSRIATARERLVALPGVDVANRDRQLQMLEDFSKRLSRVHQQ